PLGLMEGEEPGGGIEGVSSRTRPLPVSAKYILPPLPIAIAVGWRSAAWIAGFPSPEKPTAPLPAMVVIVPSEVTIRILSLPPSAMKRLPEESTATPVGLKPALMAGPPSPE